MSLRTSEIRAAIASLGVERGEVVLQAARELADRDIVEMSEEGKPEASSRFLLHPRTFGLFDYQDEVVAELLQCVARGQSALVSLPTGSGKTRTAVVACLKMIRQGLIEHVVWVAPSHELVEQARQTLRAVWQSSPGDRVQTIDGLTMQLSTGPSWRFGTVQSAASLGEKLEVRAGATVLVFDEAHQALAPTFRKVVQHVRRRQGVVFGLSATPGRYTDAETRQLEALFAGELIVPRSLSNNPVESLRGRGVLAELELVGLRDAASADGSSALQRLAAQIRHRNCAPGIAFVGRIAEAYVAAVVLTLSGIRAEVVSHDHSRATRVRKLEDIRTKRLDWLVNVEVLATGIDLPSLRAVALLTEIGSPILYEQIIGRVSRGPAVGGAGANDSF